MLKLKYLNVGLLALISINSCYGDTLKVMTDDQLSNTVGQALMSLSYIAPTDSSNLEKNRLGGAQNIGFYKLGLEAELELNANIKKLQLGCGGTNGVGDCDIDIDDLSLSGLKLDANGKPASMTSEERASTSAKLTNPFLEFAIKNPNQASTRQVVGLRLSAEKAFGLLTAGTENSTKANGINTISGYMKVQSDSSGVIKGYATTAATRDNLFGDYIVKDANGNPAKDANGNIIKQSLVITGTLQALGLGGAAEADFKTSAGGFNIPEIKNNYFEVPAIMVNENRAKSKVLSAPVNVPNIYVGKGANYPLNGIVNYNSSGPHNSDYLEPTGIYTQGGVVEATVTACRVFACLLAGAGKKFSSVYMNGTISNITADLNLTQSLGLIHNLPINSPFSLSLQQTALQWPGAKSDDIAQKGWWMSFADPVNIGYVIPKDPIDISPLFPQIASAVSEWLKDGGGHEAQTSDLGGLLGGADLSVNIGTIDLKGKPLSLNLSNLELTNQNFKANCYGNLKFC
ncbi:hypothetical protein [Acinetobacter sp. ANC 4648]|uniref:hypothetical protein n=1 Tax=Acinetobacter sp. ANC 4648 TaxID=1977875 RepID=UPI000A32F06F|nr:hypothetical protein [Acinetobacter sp. ANC 4648]OTG83836.1 hypothetical protein B9T27_04895 [Acinetobacter sp. ANC 4648]